MNPHNRIPKGATDSRRKNERGVILLLGTLSVPVLISMMGLGIDASILYGVKSKMQLAADGASLAAARALSIGLTTDAQRTSAQNNATNWFNRNFPAGEFGTSGTVLDEPQIFDDTVNPLIRHVVVTASSTAPSYFMRYWGNTGTAVATSSEATRRDSVIMMVLDRSGSMNTSGACSPMKAAAKKFTGMFSPQRDRIGMITFNMASNIASSPSLNFRSILGYAESGEDPPSATGLIDGITCTGGTGTPEAAILGYNELYKTALPGALNVLMLFTDGLPTALTFDFRGGTTSQMGILEDSTNCQDSTGKSLNSSSSTRGHLYNNPPAWNPQLSLGSGSYLSDIAAGPVATVYGDDQPLYIWGYKYYAASNSSGDATMSTLGCGVGNTISSNIKYFPDNDAFGNALALSGYNSLNYDDGKIQESNANFRAAALNAAANAANRARTTRLLPDGRSFPGVMVFCIGLGNVNHPLLQRMANDGAADDSGANAYPAFTGTNSSQPTGNYVYANDSAALGPAFSQIASFILRLSR